MKKLVEDNAINRFIRERIRLARTTTGENQSDLAKVLNIKQSSVSDMEKGRTAINAATLVQIAHHYKKSIAYFYPDEATIKLSRIEEEMLQLFSQLPTIQQYSTIDYLKQRVKDNKKKG